LPAPAFALALALVVVVAAASRDGEDVSTYEDFCAILAWNWNFPLEESDDEMGEMPATSSSLSLSPNNSLEFRDSIAEGGIDLITAFGLPEEPCWEAFIMDTAVRGLRS
jgi:hypothetical protein